MQKELPWALTLQLTEQLLRMSSWNKMKKKKKEKKKEEEEEKEK